MGKGRLCCSVSKQHMAQGCVFSVAGGDGSGVPSWAGGDGDTLGFGAAEDKPLGRFSCALSSKFLQRWEALVALANVGGCIRALGTVSPLVAQAGGTGMTSQG